MRAIRLRAQRSWIQRTLLVILTSIAPMPLLGSVSNAADIYERRTTGKVFLPLDGGTWGSILRVRNVPSGVWMVHAKVSVVAVQDPDTVRCRIRIGAANKIDQSATQIGGQLPRVATLVNQAVIATTATKTFVFECSHDGFTSWRSTRTLHWL